MANCVTCKARCIYAGQHCVSTDCISHVPKEPITKADSIRAMSDEQLAEFLKNVRLEKGDCPTDMSKCKNNCYDCWLDWLRQEADNEFLN